MPPTAGSTQVHNRETGSSNLQSLVGVFNHWPTATQGPEVYASLLSFSYSLFRSVIFECTMMPQVAESFTAFRCIPGVKMSTKFLAIFLGLLVVGIASVTVAQDIAYKEDPDAA